MELLDSLSLTPEVITGSAVAVVSSVVALYFLVFKQDVPAEDLDVVLKPEPGVKASKPEVKPEPKVKPKPKKLITMAEALSSTQNTLWGRITSSFSSKASLSSDDLEEIEEVLYTSDLGPKTVQLLSTKVSEKIKASDSPDLTLVREALRDEMMNLFNEVTPNYDDNPVGNLKVNDGGLTVWMIVGVNGAGKTTTIGKLAGKLSDMGKKVMVGAGDTFRAAADEQLKVWSERANVEIFSPEGVKDPSAVAFDAVNKAKASGVDVVIIDTAGRLHTQKNLMEELKKIKRVVGKVHAEAPHEVLLVLDGNMGQNALIQADQFHQALGVTGVVLTKMDGSAKGGVAVGVAGELKLPVKMIGIGEGIEDLRPFLPKEFVKSIL